MAPATASSTSQPDTSESRSRRERPDVRWRSAPPAAWLEAVAAADGAMVEQRARAADASMADDVTAGDLEPDRWRRRQTSRPSSGRRGPRTRPQRDADAAPSSGDPTTDPTGRAASRDGSAADAGTDGERRPSADRLGCGRRSRRRRRIGRARRDRLPASGIAPGRGRPGRRFSRPTLRQRPEGGPSAERIGGGRPHGRRRSCGALASSDGRMSTLEPVSAVRHDAARDLARALDHRSASTDTGAVPMVTDEPGSRALAADLAASRRAPHRWHARDGRSRTTAPGSVAPGTARLPTIPAAMALARSMRWTTTRPGSQRGGGEMAVAAARRPRRPSPTRPGPTASDDALARQARWRRSSGGSDGTRLLPPRRDRPAHQLPAEPRLGGRAARRGCADPQTRPAAASPAAASPTTRSTSRAAAARRSSSTCCSTRRSAARRS